MEELQATKIPSGVKVVRLGVERTTNKHDVLLNCCWQVKKDNSTEKNLIEPLTDQH